MGKNGIVQLFFPVKVKIHNLMIFKLLVDYVKGRHKIAESLGGVGYVGAGKKGGIQNSLHAVHLQAAADLLSVGLLRNNRGICRISDNIGCGADPICHTFVHIDIAVLHAVKIQGICHKHGVLPEPGICCGSRGILNRFRI